MYFCTSKKYLEPNVFITRLNLSLSTACIETMSLHKCTILFFVIFPFVYAVIGTAL